MKLSKFNSEKQSGCQLSVAVSAEFKRDFWLYSFYKLFQRFPLQYYYYYFSGKTVMCRLLCLSRGLVGTQCKYSVQKSEPFASLLTSRAKLRDQLMKRLISTSRRPVLTSHNYRLPLFWLPGIGTGFVIYICIHTHAHTTAFVSPACSIPHSKCHGGQPNTLLIL